MTTLLEAFDIGPISLHNRRVFAMEADSSIDGKPQSEERKAPTPRFRLVSIELEHQVRTLICEQHVSRPIALRIDDDGGVLLGPQSALLDASFHRMRVLEGCDPHPDKGCSLGRRYAVFGWEHDSQNEVRRIDRKSGDVITIAHAQEGRIEVVGGDDEVFGWYEEYSRVLRWSTHATPTAVIETAIPADIRSIHRADGRWLLGTRDSILVIGDGDHQQLEVKAQEFAVGFKPWFAVLGGYGAFEGSTEEVVGAALARIGTGGEIEPIFACAPAEGADIRRLLGAPRVSDLASDYEHVVFVERTRNWCRLRCLPVNAPSVERHRRVLHTDEL